MDNRGSKSTKLKGNVVKEQRVDGCYTNSLLSYFFRYEGLVLRCILVNCRALSKLGINSLGYKLFYFSFSEKSSPTSQPASLAAFRGNNFKYLHLLRLIAR